MTTTAAAKPQRRTQEERSATTRRKLIDAVVALIVEEGFSSVTTMTVADRAGVSRGAMQHHFGTRTDLLLAVIDEIMLRLQEPLALEPETHTSLDSLVGAIVDRYWLAFTQNTFVASVDIWMGARGEPELFEPLSNHMRSIFAARSAYWREAFADFDLPAERLMMAHELTSATVRGLALRRIFDDHERPPNYDPELSALKSMVLALLDGRAG